jgi:hypothetical protein
MLDKRPGVGDMLMTGKDFRVAAAAVL